MPVELTIVETVTELETTVTEVILESTSAPGPAGPGVPEGGTDGQVLTKASATDYDTAWEDPTGGSGGGAPTDVDYLVGTANGTLSAEIVVGTTPGGELGGTWASPTVDATHSGSSHAGIQAAAEATAAGALASHEADTTNIHGIADTSALATDTEVATAVSNHSADTTSVHGIADTSVVMLEGDAAGGVLGGTYPNPSFAADMATQAELDAHLNDTSDAHDASAISIADAGDDFTATDVEGALAELQSDHETDAQNLADHIADSSDAHDASAISVLDSGGDYTATDVEGVLAEIAPQLGAGGAMVLLHDETLSGDTASFDVQNISGDYKHLKIIISARGDANATSAELRLRINNVSTGTYDWAEGRSNTSAVAAGGAADATYIGISRIPADTAPSGAFSAHELLIPDYASTTREKFVNGTAYYRDGTGATNQNIRMFGGHHESTSAVTRITILPDSDNLVAGSRLTIYGLN